jgi:putative DNA methylase
MLEGLLSAEFHVTGTWPMRSELQTRNISRGTNALASSIILVCHPRPEAAPITTRKDFLASLKKELPHALRNLQKGNIAPVDLAQAAIGPGMAVFSRYKKVLETDGSPMRVRTALALINQGLDEVLSELESEFDPDTRWALAWFEQHQFDEGVYGEAEVLATAKALSISHLAEAGILHSRAGKVRLLRRDELPEGWDPSAMGRLTVWEVTQHLIRSLDQKGEKETANLKAKIGGMAEIARDLAYRLYTLCERKGWAEEAGYYNSLVVAWPSMASEEFELN